MLSGCLYLIPAGRLKPDCRRLRRVGLIVVSDGQFFQMCGQKEGAEAGLGLWPGRKGTLLPRSLCWCLLPAE